MRVMRWLVVLMTIACGASNQEIAAAKHAEYSAPAATIFDVALQVAQETYKIGDVDGTGHRFITEPQFYNAEGGRESPGAEGVVQVRDRSIRLQLLVEVRETTPGHVVVAVTPRTYQIISGSPKPRELAPDDPGLPPWVNGRVDALAVAIHDQAKQYVQP
jgi:hypothetical protein